MKKNIVILAALIVLLCIGIFIYRYFFITEIPKTPQREMPSNALFYDKTQSDEVRITDLVSYMSLEEKIAQMALVEKNSIQNIDDVATYGLGAVLSGFGGKPVDNSAEGWSSMVGGFTNSALNSRLAIPILYGADAIHGHTNVPEATVFPHAIGLGATGDVELVQKVAQATADEMRATGILWSYSPNLDLPKDIRWARVYEGFSDDPELSSKLGVAYLQGLQDSTKENIAVLGTLKHYLGAGSMVWESSSNKEFKIDQGVTPADETLLRTAYLPPYKAAVDAGALSVMAGLNSWGNTKIAGSSYLLTDILKGELGFTGFVVSDWYGVYEIKGGNYKAAVTAINAGVDMVMLPFDYKEFIENITRAVVRGDIREERIDDAVTRILRAKFALGLFDGRAPEPLLESIGNVEHRILAREAVAKSLVLLKNEKQALPITNEVRRIRVGGSALDNVGVQSGAWTVEWQGIEGNWLPQSTSILEGIRQKIEDGVVIESVEDDVSVLREKADLGIAVVGEQPYAEGWGDREVPTLSTEDLEVIKKLKDTSKKVVVVIVSGRPLLITNDIASWDSVVAAWLPGSEGVAVADVLFGEIDFTGTLPVSWPATVEQLPVSHSGVGHDGTSVLFKRGFGLKSQ